MRVLVKDEDAQKVLLNALNETLGENHGFTFNKKGFLKHKGGKEHRNAKKGYDENQKEILAGFKEITSNTDFTIDFFVQDGSDEAYTVDFRVDEGC